MFDTLEVKLSASFVVVAWVWSSEDEAKNKLKSSRNVGDHSGLQLSKYENGEGN